MEALKQLRKYSIISQEEMARTLNISLRAYQLKEKGENELKLSELIILADKFNMNLTVFINRIVLFYPKI